FVAPLGTLLRNFLEVRHGGLTWRACRGPEVDYDDRSFERVEADFGRGIERGQFQGRKRIADSWWRRPANRGKRTLYDLAKLGIGFGCCSGQFQRADACRGVPTHGPERTSRSPAYLGAFIPQALDEGRNNLIG